MVHYISQHQLKIEEFGHFDQLKQTLLRNVPILSIRLCVSRCVASVFVEGRVLARSHDHFIYGDP